LYFTATRQGDGSVVAAVVTSSMTSIDIDVSHDDVEGFAVKLQADQDTYEGFSNMTTTMAISGLSPDTLYRIDVTAVLHDGEERVTVLEIQTNQLENKTDTKPPRVIFGQEGVVILTDQTNVSSTTIYFSFEVTNNEATEIVVTWDEHHPGMGIPERVKAKVNANMDIRELSPHGPSRINVTASIADPDQSPVLYVLIIGKCIAVHSRQSLCFWLPKYFPSVTLEVIFSSYKANDISTTYCLCYFTVVYSFIVAGRENQERKKKQMASKDYSKVKIDRLIMN
jgi:hypothetical protein